MVGPGETLHHLIDVLHVVDRDGDIASNCVRIIQAYSDCTCLTHFMQNWLTFNMFQPTGKT